MIKVKKVPKGEDDEKVSLGLHETQGWSHTVEDSFQSPKYPGTVRFMGQFLPDHNFVLLASWNFMDFPVPGADGTISCRYW